MNNTLKIAKENICKAKGLLFDFDGTLVNLDKLNVDAYTLVFREMFNLEFTRDEFMKYISGKGSRNGIVGYLNSKGIREYSSQKLNTIFYEYKKRLINERIRDEIYLLPGIEEFLKDSNIKTKKKIIVTSSRKDFVEYILRYFEIYKYFNKVIDRFDVVRGKPDSEGYFKGMKYLGYTVYPLAQSACCRRSATMSQVSWSGTSAPLLRYSCTCLPSGVPSRRFLRKISPVEIWGIPISCAMRTACVPLPAPGAPSITILSPILFPFPVPVFPLLIQRHPHTMENTCRQYSIPDAPSLKLIFSKNIQYNTPVTSGEIVLTCMYRGFSWNSSVGRARHS